jgi:hypothetical protein
MGISINCRYWRNRYHLETRKGKRKRVEHQQIRKILLYPTEAVAASVPIRQAHPGFVRPGDLKTVDLVFAGVAAPKKTSSYPFTIRKRNYI